MFKKIVWLGFSTKWKNHKDVQKYIKDLVDAWATEFFTGYNPDYWSDKFGYEVSPNWRFSQHEQITDFETLKLICEEVHKHWFELFINLNAWYYTDLTFPLIQKMVWEFIEIWIDWIICGNISILEYLKEINYWKLDEISSELKINISTIMALYNTESIKYFLENYKINKIILSREVTLKEIETLVSGFPETKFEVFWEWDFCRYNNWLCFAEHKYSTRDICTVVVNDLIFKKKFRADFKKIILDESIDSLEKIWFFDDKFEDIFTQIENILNNIELFWEDYLDNKNKLIKIYKISKNRQDLFFDAISSSLSEKNKKILIYFKWLKYILENNLIDDENLKFELISLKNELENSIKTWMKEYLNKIKELSWEPKLNALKTALFYSKWDNLNLYSYLFFSKFKNIETVKFPTRGRSYNQKLKLIEETVNNWKVDEALIDRTSSLERSHYDLSYLFWDKLWFRKLINNK